MFMLNPFLTLYRSLTDPKTYPKMTKVRGQAVLTYALISYFGFALILSSYLMLRYYTPAVTAVNRTLTEIITQYPSDLILNLSENNLQLEGLQAPIIIPTQLFTLVVSGTSQPATVSASQTLIEASPASLKIAFPQLSNPLIIPYSDLQLSGTLNAAQAKELLSHWQANFQNLKPLTLTFFLTIFLLTLFLPMRLFYTLVTAFLFYFIGKLTQNPINFTTYLKLTLTSLVAAESLNLATTIIYGRLTPTVFSLAYLGYTFVAIYTVQKTFHLLKLK